MNEQPTFSMFDSSKVISYLRCEREYLFKYILGWTSLQPQLSLVFGGAVHEGLAAYYKGDRKPSTAIEPFLDEYRKSFDEVSDDSNAPRNPMGAVAMFNDYHAMYGGDPQWEVLHTEVSDEVPLDPKCETVIRFRLDLVVEEHNKIVVVDHKTAGNGNHIYTDVLQGSTQMFCYLHAAKCFYGMEAVEKLMINKIVVLKARTEVHRVPFIKTLKQLDDWAKRTIRTIACIKYDTEMCLNHGESEEVLDSFSRRETGCIQFNRLCPYYDWCWAWDNPLHHQVPRDKFKVEYWDPAKGSE